MCSYKFHTKIYIDLLWQALSMRQWELQRGTCSDVWSAYLSSCHSWFFETYRLSLLLGKAGLGNIFVSSFLPPAPGCFPFRFYWESNLNFMFVIKMREKFPNLIMLLTLCFIFCVFFFILPRGKLQQVCAFVSWLLWRLCFYVSSASI